MTNSPDARTSLSQPGGRILIVEDDMIAAGMLAASLRGNGLEVQIAHTGEAALAMLDTLEAGHFPQIIILDIELGAGIDGLEACRRIRQSHASSALPIIFLSGHDALDIRLEAYDAGGNDFMRKPFVPDEVLRKIGRIMEDLLQAARAAEDKAVAEQLATRFHDSAERKDSLLKFLRTHAHAYDLDDLADRIVHTAATDFGATCVVQFHHADTSVTRSIHGPATPLEESVIAQSRSMGRIFRFGRRLVVNLDSLTVLVLDLSADAEQAARTQECIEALAECGETIQAEIDSRKQSAARAEAMQIVSITMHKLREIYRDQRTETYDCLNQLITTIEHAYVHLGLSSRQEDELSELLRESTDRIMAIFEKAIDTDKEFDEALQLLRPAKDTSAQSCLF